MYMPLVKVINGLKKWVRTISQAGGVWRAIVFLRAEVLESKGKYEEAFALYNSILTKLKAESPPGMFRIWRTWEYYAERAAVSAGISKTDDPLFRCEIRVSSDDPFPARNAVGQFEADWFPLGLRIDGYLYKKITGSVLVYLNGEKIRGIPVRQIPFTPGFFSFTVMREVVQNFPEQAVLELRTKSGDILVSGTSQKVTLLVPHGTGTITQRLAAGASINKKGFYSPTSEAVSAMQNRLLQLYTRVNRFFEENFHRSVFILYGTLLGYYRDGDFIKGDDDFDAGFISLKQRAVDVKLETMDMVKELVLAGFIINFNRLGRLFRIRLPEDPPEVHLDLRPLWYEDGGIWAHLQAFLPMGVDDFLPLNTGQLRGTDIKYPRNSEKFLAAYYGPGWKVPDPGYSNASKKVPRFVRKRLASVCLTPKEYYLLTREIEQADPEKTCIGRLFSNGSHSLYPLASYEKDCEW